MRILLYSHAFHPSLGGLEKVSQALATELARAGHQVDLVTATSSNDACWDQGQPYRLWRRPSPWRQLQLLRRCDLVHSSGASLALALPAVLLGRPLLITHHGYQLVSVDGLGWSSEGPTPLDAGLSLRHYRSRLPRLPWLRQVLLLHLRRWVAQRAGANVAISHWMARRQPLARQQVIHNPVRLPADPGPHKASTNPDRSATVLFLGRLVREKGLDVLLEALRQLKGQQGLRPSLLVVGDGPMRSDWETRSLELGLADQVQFLGPLQGEALQLALHQASIGVVPSVWEEPFGLVAVELLAAGLTPVVSASGGLAEVVAGFGLTVANGDAQGLADALARLLRHPEPADPERLQAHLGQFAPERASLAYLSLYNQLQKGSLPGRPARPGG